MAPKYEASGERDEKGAVMDKDGHVKDDDEDGSSDGDGNADGSLISEMEKGNDGWTMDGRRSDLRC